MYALYFKTTDVMNVIKKFYSCQILNVKIYIDHAYHADRQLRTLKQGILGSILKFHKIMDVPKVL